VNLFNCLDAIETGRRKSIGFVGGWSVIETG